MNTVKDTPEYQTYARALANYERLSAETDRAVNAAYQLQEDKAKALADYLAARRAWLQSLDRDAAGSVSTELVKMPEN